jgi:uncharacterized protein YdaU (DUF1376 family)
VSVTNGTTATSKGRAPWMPFWGTDFMASTLGWSASERGAYLILLWAAWEGDGLPSDPERLFRLDPDIRHAWHLLEDKFPVHDDGRRRNPRQERERDEMRQSGKRNADRAKKAASARWDAPSNAPSNAPAMLERCHTQTHTHTQSLSETETNRDTLNGVAVEPVSVQAETVHTRTKRMPMPEGALERLWHLFPRKVGKRRAITLLERAIRDYATEWELDGLDDAIEVMRERIVAMAQQYRKTEQAYIPHPATWLQQGRYEDPIPEETRR